MSLTLLPRQTVLVAFISSLNDYQKELKFRALEKAAQADEFCTVLRAGHRVQINPSDLTVGDVLLLVAGEFTPLSLQ